MTQSTRCSQSNRGTIHGMSWIGWALLSAVFAAATALLAKVGVEHVDSNLATAIRTTVVVIFAWGIALALGKHGEIRTLDRRTTALSDAVRPGNGPLLAVLFPRTAIGPSLARSASRQAERATGDGVCRFDAGRKNGRRRNSGRPADHRRRSSNGHELAETLNALRIEHKPGRPIFTDAWLHGATVKVG